MSDLLLPSVRLAPVEMQSQRIPGRKRGRPPLHSTPMKMAVHNLYSASAGSLPAVKIPKKRGRKPGYKVWLHHLLSPKWYWAGAWVLGQRSTAQRDESLGWELGKDRINKFLSMEHVMDEASLLPRGHTKPAVAVMSIFTSGESQLHQMGKVVRQADLRVRAKHTWFSLASKLMFQTLSCPLTMPTGWLSQPLSRTHSSLILVEGNDVPKTFELIMWAG